eukprot:TRINITY_DN21628_c0_g1_i2.p3 TRINITY_DN21628_c0_g1~~TRINITY_DN21628_c0_g1_i2.p3  ORF type:complete len:113 (+),score=40.06 TRINITY_DN21628_c0_g1_i2:64-402(+)
MRHNGWTFEETDGVLKATHDSDNHPITLQLRDDGGGGGGAEEAAREFCSRDSGPGSASVCERSWVAGALFARGHAAAAAEERFAAAGAVCEWSAAAANEDPTCARVFFFLCV